MKSIMNLVLVWVLMLGSFSAFAQDKKGADKFDVNLGKNQWSLGVHLEVKDWAAELEAQVLFLHFRVGVDTEDLKNSVVALAGLTAQAAKVVFKTGTEVVVAIGEGAVYLAEKALQLAEAGARYTLKGIGAILGAATGVAIFTGKLAWEIGKAVANALGDAGKFVLKYGKKGLKIVGGVLVAVGEMAVKLLETAVNCLDYILEKVGQGLIMAMEFTGVVLVNTAELVRDVVVAVLKGTGTLVVELAKGAYTILTYAAGTLATLLIKTGEKLFEISVAAAKAAKEVVLYVVDAVWSAGKWICKQVKKFVKKTATVVAKTLNAILPDAFLGLSVGKKRHGFLLEANWDDLTLIELQIRV